MPTPIEAMQLAVDIVNTSEHDKNKIASCLFSDDFSVVGTNHRPEIMCAHLSPDLRIGKSSQFIHSEVSCIHASTHPTEGASLCVTDPFCPNCAKAIVEAGIKHVYIDHKGLDKDFAARRGEEFENLSLFMMEKAGVNVSILYRKNNKIEPLLQPQIQTRSAGASDIEFFDIADDLSLENMMHSFRNRQPHGAWACARILEESGKTSGLLVFESLPHGITPQEYEEKKDFSEKYALTNDPVNRLCFYLQRKGLKLIDNHIGVNQFPSSRAMVNSVGYGVTDFTVGEEVNKIGLNRYAGAKILEENGILNIHKLY